MSDTAHLLRRCMVVSRRARRLAAVTLITATTLATIHTDNVAAAPSCSLTVDVHDGSMTFTYRPHDNTPRTVWVDGQPHTIKPGGTATTPHADAVEYPNRGEWIVVAELVAACSTPTTTTSSSSTTTTSTTVAPTTTTEASSTETTIVVHRTTPEPTAPLPPATWTVVPPVVTTTTLVPMLPATGPLRMRDIVTVGLWLLVAGIIWTAAVRDQMRRKDDRR